MNLHCSQDSEQETVEPSQEGVETEHKAFILDIDKEPLKNAPGFDKDNWPGTQDREWVGRVYEYYGYEPYWRTPVR